MRKIKHIGQLRAEQQRLLHQQERLEEKMGYQWEEVKRSNKTLFNAFSWGLSLLSGQVWKRAGKKWFDLLK